MSSRALRRLQKESEHQQRAKNHNDISSSDEEPTKPKTQNLFDMLGDADDEDLGSELRESVPDDQDVATQTKSPDAQPSLGKKKKKKRKKAQNKHKEKSSITNEKVEIGIKSKKNTDQLDEIDRALQSLSTEPKDASSIISNPKADEEYLQSCRLLSIDSKQLNALNEMKRLFGNAVLDGDKEEAEAAAPTRRRGRGPQQLDLGGALAGRNSPASKGQGLAKLALRRNVFMVGKEEWPKATSGGLGMEVTKKWDDGTIEYRFVHNSGYQDVQRQFEVCVESMDPQRMIQMLQFNPYHISTLLQVSEIAKQQGDHSVSGDLLERALFSFGRSVHSSFTVALSEGKARFNFAWRENREFWLASWRYISNLGQRGTWRTAYEWAKLLLSLDPDKDPYCVGLILDQLALRGGQADHFLRLSQCSLSQRQWRDFPNVHISSALAQLKAKEAANCRLSLAKAVKKYPWIFTRLFQELNIENIPKSIWGNEPRSQREKLDCEMYVTAAKDLWNTPDAISFLKEVTESVTVDYLPPIQKSAISIDEARHVLISGNPALIGLIPRSFTNTSTSPSDPLPPPDSMTSYDATPPTDHESNPQNFLPLFLFADLPGLAPEFEPQDIASRSVEERAEDVQELRGLQAFFSRLIPWIAPSLADDVTDQEGTDEPRGPLQEQNFSAVASGSGPPQEQVAARGIRLIELLRRTLGREPRPGELFPATVATNDNELGGASDLENIGYLEYDTANDDELGETSDLENTGYLEHDTSPSASSPPSPTRPHIDTPERAPKAVQEPYDDDRNQRWLAGRGMLGLRDFVAIHSADEAAWSSDSTIANKGQELLTEYAKRVSLLQQERTRRFIVDYVLPQGTSGEVRDLVLRYMHTLRE